MSALAQSALMAISAALTAAQEAEVKVQLLRDDRARLQAAVERLEHDIADLRERCEAMRPPTTGKAVVLAFDANREKVG
jgi:phage shock protein A